MVKIQMLKNLSCDLSTKRSDKRLHNGIVQPGPKSLDTVIGSRGMNAIGQKDNHDFTFQIHPEGSSGKAQMPDTAFRKKAPTAGSR
jgi:hypothetical protein